jgi:hypothetical protein
MDTYPFRIDTTTLYTGKPPNCRTNKPNPAVCKIVYHYTVAETWSAKAKIRPHTSISANTSREHGFSYEHFCSVTS